MSAAELRKKTLTSQAETANTTSAASSGTSTPYKMLKTDSVVNLTKPSLYGIYDDNLSFLTGSKDDIDTDMYMTPPALKQSRLSVDDFDDDQYGNVQDERLRRRGSSSQLLPVARWRLLKSVPQAAQLPVKLGILTLACFVYNEVTKNIHNSHFLQVSSIVNQPLSITNTLISQFSSRLRPVHGVGVLGKADSSESVTNGVTVYWIDQILALMIQGLVMGSIHPIMDRILPNSLSTRLLSLAPQSQRNLRIATKAGSASRHQIDAANSALTNDLIRSFITFLGLLYAVRNVEWTLALQVSILWSLLNPCLWLLLDGTISGFISSTLAALAACVCVYFQSYQLIVEQDRDNFIAIWLWVASFFFCGLILFGKLGRALFI
jgi:hypothetical protein